MRIALVSYEYPPDTAVGGIATYMQQWARVLNLRGHDVEVFAASPQRELSVTEEGILVHRIICESRELFRHKILPIFSSRHRELYFDLFESPELNADGLEIKKKFPSLFLVVKLHAPSFLLERLDSSYSRVSLRTKINFIVGRILKFHRPKAYWNPTKHLQKLEKVVTRSADVITSPSEALITLVNNEWGLNKQIYHLPNPYLPHYNLLNLKNNNTRLTVGFLGRLEEKKGIQIFKEIIPDVLAHYPDVRFLFAGKDCYLKQKKKLSSDYLKEELSESLKSLEFVGHLPLHNLNSFFEQTDIIVIPSLWENFPTVCLEAMSAGRAIVGSSSGGMSEMLVEEFSGLLADPEKPQEFVKKICCLLADEKLRIELGRRARERLLFEYSEAKIGSQFEDILQVNLK